MITVCAYRGPLRWRRAFLLCPHLSQSDATSSKRALPDFPTVSVWSSFELGLDVFSAITRAHEGYKRRERRDFYRRTNRQRTEGGRRVGVG